MIKINLNPYKKKKKEKFIPKIKLPFEFEKVSDLVYFIPAIILIVLMLVYTFYESRNIEMLKKEKQILLVERNKYKNVQKKIRNLKNQYLKLESISREIDLKKAVYTYLYKEKPDFNFYFKIAYQALPDGIWLKSLYISKNKFRFEGASLNPVQISKLYENLKQNFNKVVFKSTKKEQNRRNIYYSFTVNAINLKIKED